MERFEYVVIRRFCLLLLILLLVDIRFCFGARLPNPKPNPETIYDALNSYGLPKGLLPKGVANFSIDEDGKFEVHLPNSCVAKFESEFKYERNVSGRLLYGQIRNLTGMAAQDLFLWFDVKGIRVDIPSSGIIYFDVGVVRKQFSLSMFENPPDCVAVSLEMEHRVVVDGSASDSFINFMSKKLDGVLRYGRVNEWKSGREVM